MTKKTKIFINGRFLTSPQTGVQRTAYELVLALDMLIDYNEIDVSSTAFVLIYSGKIVNPIQLKHIELRKSGVLSGNLWEQLELPIYTFGSFLVNLCSIAPLCKRQQLVMVHDVSFLVNKHFFSKKFRYWYANAIPLLGKLSKCIVTVSNFSKQELISRAGVDKNKITVIYNAATHLARFEEPDPAFKEKVAQLKPFYLAVSSLGANKNFNGLSLALKGLELGDHTMVIAGGKLGALANASPQEDAIYLGFVSDEELVHLYKNASLFMFPSFYEGFGIPPLEAMSMGCPVIASNTSAMPEILGDAAAYLDPHQPALMATQIAAVMNDRPLLNQLVQRGYERAAGYSWQKSAFQLYQLIKHCNG